MKGTRVPLALALFSLALLLLAFWIVDLVSGPVWLVFRRAAGLGTMRTIAQVAAALTVVLVFAAAVTIAVPVALGSARRFRKWLNVLPAYLLASTLAAMLANLLGLATLGSLLDMQSAVKISLATAWLGASAILSIIAVVIAAARANLGNRILKAAMTLTGIAVVPGIVLGLAMLAAINIVVANQSILPQAGSPGDPPGLADLLTPFEMGGGLIAVLAVLAVGSIVAGLRAWRKTAAVDDTKRGLGVDYRREGMRALVSGAAITLIVLVAMQLVPISRDNPPVRGTVQWDSTQTRELVNRACMNCHSNETQWPWYSYVAPGSWITAVHVSSARQQFNLSEITALSSNRKVRLARSMVDQIRNGVMPPSDYLVLHPEARLTPTEKEQLIQGLQNSLK